MNRVFLTGAGGFVGSRLANRLGERCKGLVRTAPAGPVAWTPVVGDLLAPDRWQSELDGISTVVHLAARTGKAPAAEHRRVNLEGTERLVRVCTDRGVRRLVFVSTIAVNFADLNRYPYAQAKREAETIVRESGLEVTIVRPTMVLGAGSPILEALEKLATMPVCPVFGSGATPIQPVHVDDLVAVLEGVLEQPSFDGEVVEVGGPVTLPIEGLLAAIRRERRGSDGPLVHLPLAPLLPLLALGETLAFGLMPFTVGQMATFRFDGTAAAGRFAPDDSMRGLGEMIAGCSKGISANVELEREAQVFARLLVGQPAPPAAVEAYVAAHRQEPFRRATKLQQDLAAYAARGTLRARMADGYARFFDPHGLLRRKLVLLLAILECTPPTHRGLDAAVADGWLGTMARLVAYGVRAVFCTALGTLRLAPLRWLSRERH